MLIAVDIGNSSIKVGAFHDVSSMLPEPRDVVTISSRHPDFGELESFRSACSTWYIASVCRPACESLMSWLRHHPPATRVRKLTYLDFPLTLDVSFPERVGPDRLAAAVAANRLRDESSPAIVVDAGSAITIDAVSASGVFLGGTIFAGMSMQARALNHDTDQLPFIDLAESPASHLIGRDTKQAIHSGIYWGTVGAVREIIERMKAELGPAQLFVAGGDMDRIVHHLDDARLVPSLVLSGIAIAAARIVSEVPVD